MAALYQRTAPLAMRNCPSPTANWLVSLSDLPTQVGGACLSVESACLLAVQLTPVAAAAIIAALHTDVPTLACFQGGTWHRTQPPGCVFSTSMTAGSARSEKAV